MDVRVYFRFLSLYPKKNHSTHKTEGFAGSIWDVAKFFPRPSFELWDFEPVIWSLYGFSGSGMWGHGLDRAGSEQGQVEDTYEWSNEPSDSMKCGEFLD
jgi:hypothetical protein